MDAGHINIFAGWAGMLLGVLSGALIGLFFHKDGWLGGYNAFSRRMVRLGHISFFGLGFINILFGFTLLNIDFPITHAGTASTSLIIGAVTMPLCCFLTAWKKPIRHLFPIPVISVATGVIILLLGWQTL